MKRRAKLIRASLFFILATLFSNVFQAILFFLPEVNDDAPKDVTELLIKLTDGNSQVLR